MIKYLVSLFLIGTALAEKPNVLLICIDDLRPELNCYGVDYIKSPHIDALAAKGRAFSRHYVQAPTCGASRYTLLTGTYGPAGNGALFSRSKNIKHPSLPAYFRQNGYTTVSVGKVSHHPGGRGGSDWDDNSKPEMPESWDRHLLPAGKWQHPRGWMHGLANGEIRKNAKDMDLFQALEGGDEIYPDGIAVEETLKQLDLVAADKKPFFLATGILRPHLPFGAPAKYLEPYKNAKLPKIAHPKKPEGKTTWHGSGEFMKYNRWGKNPNTDAAFALEVRKHYAACVTYADAQVGRIVKKLTELDLTKNTIIVVWGDHGWHLGEHAIWGKHALFEESLRSPLIVVAPEVEKAGDLSPSVAETIDIFPTLCDLAKLPKPDFLDGDSLLPQLKDPFAESKGHAISYSGKAKTIRTSTHRLIAHSNGHLELYSHLSAEGETKNIAESDKETAQALVNYLALAQTSGPAHAIVDAINSGASEALFDLIDTDAKETLNAVQSFVEMTREAFGKLTLTGKHSKLDGSYTSRSIGYDHPKAVITLELEVTSEKFSDCVLEIEIPVGGKKVSQIRVAGK